MGTITPKMGLVDRSGAWGDAANTPRNIELKLSRDGFVQLSAILKNEVKDNPISGNAQA